MSQLLHDPVAHWLIVAAAVAVVTGEIVATYFGHAREGKRQIFSSLADSLLLYTRCRGTAVRQDRGTRVIVALALYLAIAAALAAARVPRLRVDANNWWTLGLGLAIGFAGAAPSRLGDPEPRPLLPPRGDNRAGPADCASWAVSLAPPPFLQRHLSHPRRFRAYLRKLGERRRRAAYRLRGAPSAHSRRGTRARTSIRLRLHHLRHFDGPHAPPRLVKDAAGTTTTYRAVAIAITARAAHTTRTPARPVKIAAIASRGIEIPIAPSTISF